MEGLNECCMCLDPLICGINSICCEDCVRWRHRKCKDGTVENDPTWRCVKCYFRHKYPSPEQETKKCVRFKLTPLKHPSRIRAKTPPPRRAFPPRPVSPYPRALQHPRASPPPRASSPPRALPSRALPPRRASPNPRASPLRRASPNPRASPPRRASPNPRASPPRRASPPPRAANERTNNDGVDDSDSSEASDDSWNSSNYTSDESSCDDDVDSNEVTTVSTLTIPPIPTAASGSNFKSRHVVTDFRDDEDEDRMCGLRMSNRNLARGDDPPGDGYSSDSSDEEERSFLVDVEFTVVERGGKRGGPKLIDSHGYVYNKLDETPRYTTATWVCECRDKDWFFSPCPARVTQMETLFTFGFARHNHSQDSGADLRVTIRAKARELAEQNRSRPARDVAKSATESVLEQQEWPFCRRRHLPTKTSLVKIIRRHRQTLQKQPTSPDATDKFLEHLVGKSTSGFKNDIGEHLQEAKKLNEIRPTDSTRPVQATQRSTSRSNVADVEPSQRVATSPVQESTQPAQPTASSKEFRPVSVDDDLDVTVEESAGPEVMYDVIDDAGRKGAPRLVSSQGYIFTKKRETKAGVVHWACIVRRKNIICYGSVKQDGYYFDRSTDLHIHRADQDAFKKIKVIDATKRIARKVPAWSSGRVADAVRKCLVWSPGQEDSNPVCKRVYNRQNLVNLVERYRKTLGDAGSK